MHRLTWDDTRLTSVFAYATVTLFGMTFQTSSANCHDAISWSRNPTLINQNGLGCSRFARHYSGNRLLFLFLRILRCFTSPRLASLALWIHARIIRCYSDWVAPFGHLRVNACLRLSEAYRSLLRPSSPIEAKAFTACS